MSTKSRRRTGSEGDADVQAMGRGRVLDEVFTEVASKTEPSTLGLLTDKEATGTAMRTLSVLVEAFQRPAPNDVILSAAEALANDLEIMMASRRWQPGRLDPDRFVPGDAVALRAMAGRPAVQSALLEIQGVGTRSGTDMEILALECVPFLAVREARQFFLPGGVTDAVLEADAPEDDVMERLRMPAKLCSVWFGDGLPLPTDLEMPEEVRSRIEEVVQEAHRRGDALTAAGMPYLALEDHNVLGDAMLKRDSQVVGVCFVAPSGRLADFCLLVCAVEPDSTRPWPENLDRLYGQMLCVPSRSGLGAFLRTLAATVAWAAWREPVAPIDLPLRGDISRIASTGAWRRREPQGAFAQVRVLDLSRSVPRLAPETRSGADSLLERCSPIPHWRHPHLRRVRVGSRSEWHYEVREIAGTHVVPHGPVRSGEIIWRIPKAEAG